jgi:imidazolonepropionase-like amidohydrolase
MMILFSSFRSPRAMSRGIYVTHKPWVSRLRSTRTALLFGCALFASPAHAETVIISNAKIVVGDGSAPIDYGLLVIDEGKITGVYDGRTVRIRFSPDARHIDAQGKWVTPGIFAGFSRIGLSEVDAVAGANDKSAGKSGFSAGLDVAPAIDPSRSAIAVNRTAGVTRAVVAPEASGNIFAGQGAIVDLGEGGDAVTKPRAFQFVEFGEDGGKNGGGRMASHVQFRAMLREAKEYGAGKGAFDDELLKAEDAKALLPVLRGETRLLIHVEDANDMLQMIKLRQEFPALKMVFVGASEGWRVARQIAAAGIPVIASALNDLPAEFEQLAATQSNIGRMKAAGVKIAIGMINDRDAHQLRYSAQYAGNLVSLGKVPGATGLSWDDAFAAISSGPADIMGVGEMLGSLKAGHIADIVIWDGDPLELSSAPEMVFIDGHQQSLDNRQKRLRDRYRTPQEGILPKAYDH